MQKSGFISDLKTLLTAAELKSLIDEMPADEALVFLHDWRLWAREKQIAPDWDWVVWLILAGRGWGKTRTGAEWVIEKAQNGYKFGALIGRTAADVRDVMVEGESGILAKSPPWFRPLYEPSKRRLTFPNGGKLTTYSGDKPDQLRGPQHDYGWCDETAAWRYPSAWDMFMFGLRLGENPQAVVTTTPRPVKLIRELVADERTHVTTGSTYENIHNLSPQAVRFLRNKYEGTRLGRQELLAEILDDVPGALWTRGLIEKNRVRKMPEIKRIVVALDPGVSSTEGANEFGILVCGLGVDDYGYVLEDESGIYSPAEWAKKAIYLYDIWQADKIVAEKNNGGDMISHTIRTAEGGKRVAIKLVWASKGKYTRAEPVASLYEQNKIYHIGGFPELEDQMCTWIPGEKSPDRMDAMVWAFTELMIGPGGELNMSENPFYR
jgi:phage terminase large subunit-like protein